MVNRPDCVCVLVSPCACGKCVLVPRDQMVMRPVAMYHDMSVSGPQEANRSSDHSMYCVMHGCVLVPRDQMVTRPCVCVVAMVISSVCAIHLQHLEEVVGEEATTSLPLQHLEEVVGEEAATSLSPCPSGWTKMMLFRYPPETKLNEHGSPAWNLPSGQMLSC